VTVSLVLWLTLVSILPQVHLPVLKRLLCLPRDLQHQTPLADQNFIATDKDVVGFAVRQNYQIILFFFIKSGSG